MDKHRLEKAIYHYCKTEEEREVVRKRLIEAATITLAVFGNDWYPLQVGKECLCLLAWAWADPDRDWDMGTNVEVCECEVYFNNDLDNPVLNYYTDVVYWFDAFEDDLQAANAVLELLKEG